MPPVLEIIVPHYKEPWDVGEKLFQTIGVQRGIDYSSFRVTIVNDGGNRLPCGCLSDFPYNVRQIDIPHGGVSAARNYGIDNTDAEWLMFCDFDDVFANVYALRDVMTVLPADGYDMLWSKILIEDFTNGKSLICVSPESQRFVFTHAKVYRTAFLRETGIRFDETMNFQEDSLFNAVIIAKTPYTRIGEIRTQAPLYIWVRRDSSVTNSGREDEAILGHFRRNLMVTEENRLNRAYDNYCGMVTRTVYDTYFMIRGNRASPQLKRKILDVFIPWITERINEFANIDDKTLEEIRNISALELWDEPTPKEHEDVAQWLNFTLKRGVK